MGTPFPRSCALEEVEGYILTRTAFTEMCQKTPPNKSPMKKVARRIFKSLSPFIFKTFYTFNWKIVNSGAKLLTKGDQALEAIAVIRGRLKKQDQASQDDYFMFGVLCFFASRISNLR